MASLKIDETEFKAMLGKLQTDSKSAWMKTGKHFRDITPKDRGNAQNKTTWNARQIKANYDYAGVLDDGLYPTKNSGKPGSKVTSKGYSKQAPDGMTEPSLEYFEKELNRKLRGL